MLLNRDLVYSQYVCLLKNINEKGAWVFSKGRCDLSTASCEGDSAPLAPAGAGGRPGQDGNEAGFS